MNPDCEKCGLLETCNGPVPDDGGDYSILAVGESPGTEEDEEGRPFVGKSGKILRDALISLDYPMDKVTFTNVVKCHPPNNDTKPKYIRCCYQSLPIKTNTKLVLLLGNVPLLAVLGETGITSWNGVLLDRDGIIYAPVFHPAYFTYHHDDGTMESWLDALDNALDAYENGMDKAADSHYQYIYPVYGISEVYAMCKELMKAPVISFDLEFSNLDPYADNAKIIACSFATKDKAWAIPIDHPEDLVPAAEQIVDAICNVLENHPHIVGHNIKMDQMQADVLWGCRFNAKGDSMLASFLYESVKGIHGLKRLAGYYLGMYEYDAELQEFIREHPEADPSKGGSYEFVPIDILMPYAAMDAAACWLLEPLMRKKLTEKQAILYEQLTMPVSNALYRMQVYGMTVDHDVADWYRRLYSQAKRDELASIRDDPMVKKFVAGKKKTLRNAAKDRFQFNPGSYQQKDVVLYGTNRCLKGFLKNVPEEKWKPYAGKYYDLEPLANTDTGSPSTRRDWIEPYAATCPLVKHLIGYSKMSKMLGTYINPVATGSKLSGDGKARSSFNLHVVETGRTSSSGYSRTLGFNQQNIPTPEKEPDTILAYQPIKRMFRNSFKGGCLMSADYAGMELRVFASLAKCYPMIEIHESGVDFHTMVGSMVSGLSYDDITKEDRYRYKWTNWTLLYGGNEYTLYRLYGIDLDVGRTIIKKYYGRFPEVREYQRECIRFARQYGYIESPFGTRRPLPAILDPEKGRREHAEREAVNTPTQGGAGLVTLMAIVIIDELMIEEDFKSVLINTVHDSIVTDVYPGELDAVAELQIDVMENIIEYAAVHMPDVDMSWLICPLKADVEVGSHYGLLEHYQIGEEK